LFSALGVLLASLFFRHILHVPEALFGLEGDMLTRAVAQIRFVVPFYILLIPSLVFIGMMKGAGDVVFSTIAISIELALRVALSYLLVHLGVLGYSAVWVTFPIGWALLLVLAIYRLRSGKWKTKSLVG